LRALADGRSAEEFNGVGAGFGAHPRTSCARRLAGIASMRCAHFGNARRLGRARSRHRESASVDMVRRSRTR
jgi:hypothetical protein